MVVAQIKPPPTKRTYYQARSSAVPIRVGKERDRCDGAVKADDVLGANAGIRLEVIGRAPLSTAREWSELNGKPESQLADTAYDPNLTMHDDESAQNKVPQIHQDHPNNSEGNLRESVDKAIALPILF